VSPNPDLFVRRAGREDMDTFVAWMDDPALLGFIHGDRSRAARELREQQGAAMPGAALADVMPAMGFYVLDSGGDRPAGLVVFHEVSWRNRSCRFDTYLRDRAASMQAPLGCAVRYCFNEMNLHRVARYVTASDTETAAAMQALGGVREATLKNHALIDGDPTDVHVYGVLRSEFLDNGPQA
jgi:RimJ/RimL family protein N-acetyltransferase